MSDYLAFADRLIEHGTISDPWLYGEPRFREEPVVLEESELTDLYRAAEDMATAYDEASRLLVADPALLDEFYRLTPSQKAMWIASPAPLWHGIARADVFRTADGGFAICELNVDTPTGEPEAVSLGAIAAEGSTRFLDPNAGLEDSFMDMLEATAGALLEGGMRGPVAIVYPTELTEDLAVIDLYRRWLEARGHEVVLASPFNLTEAQGGGVAALGTRCDVFVRHYKTDWWSERRPIFDDEVPCADAEPLTRPLSALLSAICQGQAVCVNPFGSVALQNKRTMALLWEKIDRFSPQVQATVRALLPLTLRLEALPIDRLAHEQAYWVLKSDYGCEGDSVYVGNAMSKAEWEECLLKAIPERWVAQRYFAADENAAGEATNFGVYVVGGRASGIYSRVEAGMTTHEAQSAPTLVRR